MPLKKQNGRIVRVPAGTSPPEVTTTTEFDSEILACHICGREYKTFRGLENHVESHTEEE